MSDSLLIIQSNGSHEASGCSQTKSPHPQSLKPSPVMDQKRTSTPEKKNVKQNRSLNRSLPRRNRHSYLGFHRTVQHTYTTEQNLVNVPITLIPYNLQPHTAHHALYIYNYPCRPPLHIKQQLQQIQQMSFTKERKKNISLRTDPFQQYSKLAIFATQLLRAGTLLSPSSSAKSKVRLAPPFPTFFFLPSSPFLFPSLLSFNNGTH